jgi:hypothetical protein
MTYIFPVDIVFNDTRIRTLMRIFWVASRSEVVDSLCSLVLVPARLSTFLKMFKYQAPDKTGNGPTTG